jgi:hypothetical protein
MKHTKHLCDFCGGPITEPHTTVTIPLNAEQRWLLDRCTGSSQKPAEEPVGWFVFGQPTIRAERVLDMCATCTGGLMSARMRHATDLAKAVSR